MTGAAKSPKKLRLSVEDVAFIQQRRPRLRHKDDQVEVYRVPSLESDAVYVVTNRLIDSVVECNCPGFQYAKGNPRPPCKHVLLVKMTLGTAPRREIIMDPWKGKDNVQFEYRAHDATWVVITHQKDKDTMEVELREYEVPHKAVETLYSVLKELGADKAPVPAQTIWELLIIAYNLHMSVNEFNGGSNRGKAYFPLYYYPAKVLEHLGYVLFGSKTTELLKVRASVETGPP